MRRNIFIFFLSLLVFSFGLFLPVAGVRAAPVVVYVALGQVAGYVAATAVLVDYVSCDVNVLWGCGGGGDGGSSAPVVNGACSATHYGCTEGTSVSNVSGSGSWTWSCEGYGGGTTASCSESKAPTATLSANPSTIDSGQSSTLTWSSTYATSCTAAGGFSTGGATSGSASTGVLTSTQNYQVSCTGPDGSANSNIATVTVRIPTVSIGAAPDRVASGAATTISWSATNVNSCTITRNVTAWLTLIADASRALSGSTTDTVTTQTTYVISCTNNASATATAATATKVVNIVSDFEEF
ncbi:MAG: hypothetical protein AAB831_02190 [Patescibacteria group bacterium]